MADGGHNGLNYRLEREGGFCAEHHASQADIASTAGKQVGLRGMVGPTIASGSTIISSKITLVPEMSRVRRVFLFAAFLGMAPSIALFVYRPAPPAGIVGAFILAGASFYCFLWVLFPQRFLRMQRRVEHETEKERHWNPLRFMR